jgi:hypothetical protein
MEGSPRRSLIGGRDKPTALNLTSILAENM